MYHSLHEYNDCTHRHKISYMEQIVPIQSLYKKIQKSHNIKIDKIKNMLVLIQNIPFFVRKKHLLILLVFEW